MPPVIPYTRQTWVDGSGGATPISAARLGVLEEGIVDVSQTPAVRVYHSTTQSIANAAYTAIAFDSERFDQAGGAAAAHHNTVTNNSRLTCLYAGIYDIAGGVEWAANATGQRFLQIRLNGTTGIAISVGASAAVDSTGHVTIQTIYQLAINDYVELMAYQTSGAGLNISNIANSSPEFMMVRIG